MSLLTDTTRSPSPDTVVNGPSYDSSLFYRPGYEDSNPDCVFYVPELRFWLEDDINAIRPTNYNPERSSTLRQRPQDDQRSEEWFAKRKRVITASIFASILGLNPYCTCTDDIILEKCGHGLPMARNATTQFGVKFEPIATRIYELRTQRTIHEVGLFFHDSIPYLAASPDGLRDDGVMLEIKCTVTRTITGIPPVYYFPQMQLQMEVADLERCDFLECKISDGWTAEDYEVLYDTTPQEKGVVLTFQQRATPIGDDLAASATVQDSMPLQYVYAEINIHPNDIPAWIAAETAKIATSKSPEIWDLVETTYWRLDTVSCVPVFRDRDWFAYYLPRTRDFWHMVEYHRENGCESLLQRRSEKQRKALSRRQKKYGQEQHDGLAEFSQMMGYQLTLGSSSTPTATPAASTATTATTTTAKPRRKAVAKSTTASTTTAATATRASVPSTPASAMPTPMSTPTLNMPASDPMFGMIFGGSIMKSSSRTLHDAPVMTIPATAAAAAAASPSIVMAPAPAPAKKRAATKAVRTVDADDIALTEAIFGPVAPSKPRPVASTVPVSTTPRRDVATAAARNTSSELDSLDSILFPVRSAKK